MLNMVNNEIIYMENFRARLVELINNSNLSIGNAYYVYKTVFNDLQNLYDNALKEATKNFESQQQEEKE